MYKSIDKFLQILKVESQGQFQDKTIIGGFERYFPNVLAQMQSENVPQIILDSVIIYFYFLQGFTPTGAGKSDFLPG